MIRKGDRYRDGVGIERCATCHTATRAADDEPVISIRVRDVEELVCLLEQYVDCPDVWADTITRLEQACGRTVAQICEAEHARRNTRKRNRG
jgi:hypothetical protein